MKYETLDSGKRKDFESGMRRDTEQGKARYDLLYRPMLKRWAELMSRGAKKYGVNNWQLANSQEELDRFEASAFRHFIQWVENEQDEDHASAVFFNISAAEMVKEKLKTLKKVQHLKDETTDIITPSLTKEKKSNLLDEMKEESEKIRNETRDNKED